MAWKDVFTKQAKSAGYEARSVFKLKEIDKKYNIFRKGDNVVDLGCYPGSWIQYAQEKVGDGIVIGIDLKQIPPLRQDVVFIKKDVYDLDRGDFDVEINVVLSDMAPSTTGIRDIDQGASLDLAYCALGIAKMVRAKVFVCKYFQGPESDEFVKELKGYFGFVRTFKPKSSRSKSIEMYAVCKKV